MTHELLVEFCGEEHVVAPGSVLVFGRDADLEIDSNPYLHRHLGRFVDRAGIWFLDHLGSRTPLTVRDVHGSSSAVLAPGASIALTHAESSLAFTAGRISYELRVAHAGRQWEVDLLGPDGLSGTRTLDWGRVDLNQDQHLLLLAICEPWLNAPGPVEGPLPTNRQGAQRLGWSLPKFNRKLDHLCQKLHRAGVPGVHGAAGDSALERRRHLIQHAIEACLVSPGELVKLDGHGSTRASTSAA